MPDSVGYGALGSTARLERRSSTVPSDGEPAKTHVSPSLGQIPQKNRQLGLETRRADAQEAHLTARFSIAAALSSSPGPAARVRSLRNGCRRPTSPLRRASRSLNW